MVVPKDMELYPLRVMDRDAVSLLDLVYESLIEIDDNREPVPSLATSWEVLADGRTWLFTLRDEVYFHDGRKLTAYDVAATMDQIAAIAQDSSLSDNQKGLYQKLPSVCASWVADDEKTLRVRTERPYFGLLYAMTFPVLQAQSAMQPSPPGTGPYRIESYTPGDQIWLRGNENWWGRPPYITDILGQWCESDDAALKAFEAEDVDILMTRSTAAIRYRGTLTSRANSYTFSTRQLECLLMDHYVKLLSDARMRKAIAHAINKKKLETAVYQNVVTPTDTLQSPASWLYNDNTVTYGYDPAAANALLDELGWQEFDKDGYRIKRTESGVTTLSLRLDYYDEAGNALRKEAAGEIAAMLKAVGIKVQVIPNSFSNAANKLLNRNYDLFLCAYNFDAVPDPNFILLRDGYGNYASYRSDEMTKLCQSLWKATEKDDFQQVWLEIQDMMARDCPFLPLYWRNGVVLTKYPYSSVRDIRELELLKSIEIYR